MELEVLEDRIVPATWYVTATTDNGGDGGVGAGNKGDLRFCVAQAANNDTINLQGVNGQTILLNSQINVTQNLLEINDPNNLANVTISGQNKTRIFEVTGSSEEITNITFTGGNGSGSDGGAILVDQSASLGLVNDTFQNNQTTGANTNGGAIENHGNTSVVGCSFDTNTAANNGGAIENTGILDVNQSQNSPAVKSSFTSNTAQAGHGGAIDSNGEGAGVVIVQNSTFDNNTATQGNGGAIATNDGAQLYNDTFGTGGKNQARKGAGGAIYAYTNVGGSVQDLNVNFCTFASNQAAAGQVGGAIDTIVPTDVEHSTFTNNQSGGPGGALYASLTNGADTPANWTMTLNLDSFSGNRSGLGGGAYIETNCGNGSFSVVVTNDTFNGNNSTGSGGGIYINQTTNGNGTSSTATLTNDTFYQNSATNHGGGSALYLKDSTGSSQFVSAALTSLTVYQNTAGTDSGGLYLSSALTKVVNVDNSILSNNFVTAKGYNGPVDVTLSNNNVAMFDKEQYNLVGTSDTMFTSNTDPQKTDTPGLANGLAANGAPTGYPLTLALLRSSPGYDHGDYLNLGWESAPLGTDERGFRRIYDPFLQSPWVSIGAEDPDALSPAQQGQSTTAVRSTMNPALPGQPVTLIATVGGSGSIPTGTVSFYDGFTELGTAPLDGYGSTTLTTSSLPLGSNTITAVYSGDSNYSGSSGSFTQVISQEASSYVSLYSSGTTSTLNQPVTFTATVSGGNGTSTGSVAFLDGDTVLGTAPLDGNGNAIFTTSALLLGSHNITAVYSGDATYGSSSASLTQMVNQGGSSTSVTADNNPAQPGQSVTFTATVIPEGSTNAPTGTVTFLDGTTTISTGTLAFVNGQYQATFTTSSLSSGSHTITTVYSGDSTFADSSGSMTETVGSPSGATSQTYLTSSANSSLGGQSVTFTANLSGGSGTPTGTVTFLEGTTVLGTATLDANGNATFTTSALSLGNNDILAVYSGDSTYVSSAATLIQQVGQAGTSTSLSSSANPSPSGQPVTFTVTVGSPDPNAGTPTGLVSFFDGTTFLGNATLAVVNGQVQATFTTSALGVGTHDILAIYSGDNTFAQSESSLEETISS